MCSYCLLYSLANSLCFCYQIYFPDHIRFAFDIHNFLSFCISLLLLPLVYFCLPLHFYFSLWVLVTLISSFSARLPFFYIPLYLLMVYSVFDSLPQSRELEDFQFVAGLSPLRSTLDYCFSVHISFQALNLIFSWSHSPCIQLNKVYSFTSPLNLHPYCLHHNLAEVGVKLNISVTSSVSRDIYCLL